MHRTGPRAATDERRAQAERPDRLERGRAFFGRTRIMTLAREAAEQTRLIDRLVRAPSAHLGRAIRREQDQGDA